MLNSLHNTEIEYIKCFSEFDDGEKTIKFYDKNIPDMYSHNFTLLKSKISEEEIKEIISKEIERSIRENKDYLQITANFPINEKVFEGLSITPEITTYCYMSITANRYDFLKQRTNCTIEEAISQKVLDDGIEVDILANSPFMGEEFSGRRINRKAQIYTSNKNLKFYVCYDNDTPVGNCELFINNKIAKIEDFDILEKYQRQGFGTTVLKHLLQVSESHGVETVYLITDSADTAKDMYMKCGFSVVGEKTTLFFKL